MTRGTTAPRPARGAFNGRNPEAFSRSTSISSVPSSRQAMIRKLLQPHGRAVREVRLATRDEIDTAGRV